ncbi:MAG: HAMP domain-containing histidine kinase [Calditrichaeota bacterium]|nr:HAMP domain-containing histidine kinase [Calditrichota bacterium]
MDFKFRIPSPGELFPFLDTSILQDRLGWSVKLRWMAIIGYFLATMGAKYLLEFNIPYHYIWLTLFTLLLINCVYYLIQKLIPDISFFAELVLLSIHIIIDLIFLSLLIHFSGGIENPVYLFYLFHVVLSSIVFPRRLPYLFSTLVVVLFSLLIYVEYMGILPHYTIYQSDLHINKAAIGLIITVFAITVYVTTHICMTFMKIYRHSKQVIDHQNQQLIEASKQKMRFFRYASHELKSPIVAIKSTIDSVLASFGHEMDPTAVNLLRRSSTRAEQMLEIIKDLLELSRSRTLIVRAKDEAINIRELLEEVVAQESVLAREKQIELKLDIRFNKLKAPFNKGDLEKVLRNLINNAIRYTPEKGQIEVKAYLKKNLLVFKIKDTGIGIAEKDLQKIFSEFYRSENAKKMVNFGTGLGLSLVKQLVESYGGTVSVYSKINKGSTFVVRFPLRSE